jgi:menaquinone-9 beta-reductase
MPPTYDVIIIGAGPAGSSTAFHLAQHGLRVLILDKATFPRDKTCGDGIVPRALPILERMGVLRTIQQQGQVLDHLDVYAPHGQSLRILLPEQAQSAVVLPRLQLDHLLLEAAIQSGAVFMPGQHVQQIQVDQDGVMIQAQGEVFRGHTAVLATGASSGLFEQIGLPIPRHPIVAARAYFEDIPTLEPVFQFRFDGVVLPGYGWIFPTGTHSANIGTGFIRAEGGPSGNVQQAFHQFVRSPALAQLLNGARQVGPVKSFPIRTDFPTARTYAERILLVGEAAGLVNPLTGDGIDFALESGEIAAEHLREMMEHGDFARMRFERYDAALRVRYQSLFQFCQRIADFSLRRRRLNSLVMAARHFPGLAQALVRVVIGVTPTPETLTPTYILKGVLRNLKS